MAPLRIDFTLRTPMVVPDRPLHLDGLIACAAFRTAERAGDPNPLEATENLPLERHESGGRVVWKASQFEFEQEGGVFWNHYVRRFEINRWGEDRAKGRWTGKKDVIPLGAGHQKGFVFVQPLANVRRATAWCVGDADLMRALLEQEIDALGRNTRMGWGRVEKLEVSASPKEEAEHWRRRVLPFEMDDLKLPGHYAGTATVCPPYWNRAGWQKAWEFDASAIPENRVLAGSQGNKTSRG